MTEILKYITSAYEMEYFMESALHLFLQESGKYDVMMLT